jgi:16S rRNA (guanine527-N7)-methyltransferase
LRGSVSRETLARQLLFHVKHSAPGWLKFQDLLRVYGAALDLTGPGLDFDQQWEIAAAVAEFVPGGARVGDLGAGAGFPGIPLAVQRPDAQVLLVERRERRATFLRRATGELGLGNVEIFAGPAESFRGRPVDVLVAQMVGRLRRVWRASRRMLAESGRIVTIRGSGYEREVEELNQQGVVARLVGERVVGEARVIAVDWWRG